MPAALADALLPPTAAVVPPAADLAQPPLAGAAYSAAFDQMMAALAATPQQPTPTGNQLFCLPAAPDRGPQTAPQTNTPNQTDDPPQSAPASPHRRESARESRSLAPTTTQDAGSAVSLAFPMPTLPEPAGPPEPAPVTLTDRPANQRTSELAPVRMSNRDSPTPAPPHRSTELSLPAAPPSLLQPPQAASSPSTQPYVDPAASTLGPALSPPAAAPPPTDPGPTAPRHPVSETASTPRPPVAQLAPVLLASARSPSGTQHLTIRLDPPELGVVQIRVERPADAPARVEITAQRPETLHLLMRDQPQLQHTLDQAGVPPEGRNIAFQLELPDRSETGRHAGSHNRTTPVAPAMSDQPADSDETLPPPTDSARWMRVGLDITA